MKNSILLEWEKLSKEIGGSVSFKEQIRANIDGYILIPTIVKEELKGTVTIEQTIMVYGENNLQFIPIIISYKTSCKKELNLQIWEKGFFDKLFNVGDKIGNDSFDKKFVIKTKSKTEMAKLLHNNEIRNYLLNNYQYFNIVTTNGDVIITLKVEMFNDILKALLIIRMIETELFSFLK